jgi:hypothetical protein
MESCSAKCALLSKTGVQRTAIRQTQQESHTKAQSQRKLTFITNENTCSAVWSAQRLRLISAAGSCDLLCGGVQLPADLTKPEQLCSCAGATADNPARWVCQYNCVRGLGCCWRTRRGACRQAGLGILPHLGRAHMRYACRAGLPPPRP